MYQPARRCLGLIWVSERTTDARRGYMSVHRACLPATARACFQLTHNAVTINAIESCHDAKVHGLRTIWFDHVLHIAVEGVHELSPLVHRACTCLLACICLLCWLLVRACACPADWFFRSLANACFLISRRPVAFLSCALLTIAATWNLCRRASTGCQLTSACLQLRECPAT
jgi:hypothetical protein